MDSLKHCQRCSGEEVCDQCNPNIARLDVDGFCTDCIQGWTEATDKTYKNCECLDFVNVEDGNKCQTCSTLINQCTKCEQVESPGQEFSVFIGYDIDLSPRAGEYVICK